MYAAWATSGLLACALFDERDCLLQQRSENWACLHTLQTNSTHMAQMTHSMLTCAIRLCLCVSGCSL
jgi:hypothetical protein